MDDIVNRLETRIKALMEKCERLMASNSLLTQNKNQLLRDKEVLVTKHKVTVLQIEAMVSRLKLLEKLP